MEFLNSTLFRDVGMSFFADTKFDGIEPICQPKQASIVLPEDIGDIAVLLTHPYVGGDDELGHELLRHFIENYSYSKARERRLILTYDAVRLACATVSPRCLEAIYGFVKRNGILLICEVSARKLGIFDSIKIGRLAGVEDIYRCLISSQKVIRL
ncbi:hypothetical protein IJT17_09550 [bacterium]|nr:hypothetical protein [bacterium]